MVRRKSLLIGFLAPAAAVLLLTAGPSTPGPHGGYGPFPVSYSAETKGGGKAVVKIYRNLCLTCHGPNGKGLQMKPTMPTIPNFASRKWQKGVTDPQLLVSILDGKGTLMPGYRDRLSDEQVQDLVAYVRSFGRRGKK